MLLLTIIAKVKAIINNIPAKVPDLINSLNWLFILMILILVITSS
ncbi:hypothetical protein [Rickettsia conorii]|nr:hypothetical protein [Rickettsia conorii]UZW38679.1 hypothetical protein OSR38_07065 [Rickettsia conorii subsp. heilongjiangensis]